MNPSVALLSAILQAAAPEPPPQPRPQPGGAVEAVDAALARTTRIRVIGAGTHRGKAFRGPILLEVEAPEDLAALRRLLRVAEESMGICACVGDQAIELYEGDALIVALGLHHAAYLRLGPLIPEGSDHPLRDPPGLVGWLADHGVPGPRREYLESQERARAAAEHRRRWLDAAPAPLRSFPAVSDVYAFGPAPEDVQAMLAALRAALPGEGDPARALFAWNAAGTGLWSGFPGYEAVAERLLLACGTDELIAALEAREPTPAEAEGAARYFAGWDFRRQKGQEAGRLSPALRTRLLAAGLAGGDEDRHRRAHAAFQPR